MESVALKKSLRVSASWFCHLYIENTFDRIVIKIKEKINKMLGLQGQINKTFFLLVCFIFIVISKSVELGVH